MHLEQIGTDFKTDTLNVNRDKELLFICQGIRKYMRKMFYVERLYPFLNMALIHQMSQTLDSGDPMVKNWAFIENTYLPFLLSFMYVFISTKLGPHLMKNRKPFSLRYLMIAYNFLLVIIYFVSVVALFYILFTTDAYNKVCFPSEVRKNHYTYYAASIAWVLYLLKYIEFADTIFFVLRKKNYLITNLHVFHHAVLPIIAWFLFRSERSGFQFVPGVINSIVHIVMYTYYGLAAIGPEVQKYLWWKEYLTKFQMLQFVAIIIFVMVILPITGCKTTTHGIYLDIFFAFVFLAMFINFYTKTYKKSPKKVLGLQKSSNFNVSNGKVEAFKEE